MEVLEKGEKQKGWAIKTRCTGKGNGGGGCTALLKVDQSDMFKTASSVMGEVTYYVTFRCCECGVMTDLQNSDRGPVVVPNGIKIAKGVSHPDGGWCHPNDLEKPNE